MERIRIGFIGVGNMGQIAHLRNYVALENCRVVALAEVRPKLAEQVARRYGVEKVYADHRAMLAAETLDAVVAIQQFQAHTALLPEVYPLVRFVLTEKPLALSVAAGEKLAGAAAKAGCTHMVGYHKRSDPATVAAMETISRWKQSGEMGPLKYVRILMPPGDWVCGAYTDLIRSDEPRPGQGMEPMPADMDEETAKQYLIFVNYYIHQVNLMRLLLGEPYRVTYAEKSGVLMAVEGDSGVPGVIEMAPYRTTVGWEESALITFEKGYVRLELPAPLATYRPGTVEVHADPGDGAAPQRSRPDLPWFHAMRRQAENFVKVCRGEMPPPCDATEAAEDLKVARQYIRLRHGK